METKCSKCGRPTSDNPIEVADTLDLINGGKGTRTEYICNDCLDGVYHRMTHLHPLVEHNIRKSYTGFAGPQTVQAVARNVSLELWAELNRGKLTGRQMGMIMSAVNQAYHNGRASTGADVIDGEAVWIGKLGHLYELADIAKLTPSVGRKQDEER